MSEESPKNKWGSITKCRFPLGYQRMTNYELMQSVERLTTHRPRKIRPWWNEEWKHKKGSKESIEKIVTKLTTNASENVTDSNRVAKGRILNMGVVNSFAWKGYN